MDDADVEELLSLMRDVRFLLWVNSQGDVASLVDQAFEGVREG